MGDRPFSLGASVEIWLSIKERQVIVYQRFVISADPNAQKSAFIKDIPQRRFADALLMLCGESNIASLVRATGQFSDPFEFNDRPAAMGVSVILNPVHDYMRRYEMPRKCQYYSRDRRLVISPWNQGKPSGEASLPWTAFYDGRDLTDSIREISFPIPGRPDIRIGVLDRSARA